MRLSEELIRIVPGDVTLFHRTAASHPFYDGKQAVGLVAPRGALFAKQLLFNQAVRKYHLDVLHDTYHFPPFLFPSDYARVMTVADLTPLLMKTHNLRNRLAHKLLFPLLVRRADHIVTISQYTRDDIIRVLGVPPDKVTATPLAADESLAPVEDAAHIAETRARYALPERFFLYVGTIEPRKNLPRVLDALSTLRCEHADVRLAIVGARGWGQDLARLAARLDLTDNVLFLGRVPEEDLSALYSGATALVFPSLYEGFGLPPLEALQCACPVITSNVSSLPEVVGEAAILVDPQSTSAIAEAMKAILNNECLARELKAKGPIQAKRFSWRRCAEATLAVYERVATLPARSPRHAIS